SLHSPVTGTELRSTYSHSAPTSLFSISRVREFRGTRFPWSRLLHICDQQSGREIVMFVQSSIRRVRAIPLWVASSMLLAGCATTPPQPKFTHTMVADSRIAAADTVDVVVETEPNISVLPAERDLVAQKIKARIDDRKTKNAAASPPRTMQVLLHVTRYEK